MEVLTGRSVGGTPWGRELKRWFAPFLAHLSRAEQRTWAPVYLRGLLGPGERKSIEPIAERADVLRGYEAFEALIRPKG